MTPCTLRPVGPDDEPFLRALFLAARPDLAVLPPALVDLQFRAQQASYARYADASIVQRDDAPVGRLIVHRAPDEIRLVDVALLPAHRGQGLGAALVGALQAEARASGRPLRLHVAADNPALRLYRRLGFAVVAEEPPYLRLEWR
jgi:ribosomal protein S18 acetylase RimI-like enzyme